VIKISFIFLYGRPGTGKTTLPTTLVKMGHRVRHIDVDGKAHDMYNLQPFIEDGSWIIQPIKAPLLDSGLRDRVKSIVLTGGSFGMNPPSKQPQGYLEFVDIIDNLSKLNQEGKKDPDGCTVLVAPDSLTILLEHLTRLLLFLTKKGKFERDHWAAWLSNLEEIFHTLQSLQGMYKHVIVIAHEQVDRDEDTGRVVGIYPQIAGSMRYKVGDYFTEIYHTKVDVPAEGPPVYYVETRPVGKAEARTSRQLDTEEESDFAVLFKEELEKRNVPSMKKGKGR